LELEISKLIVNRAVTKKEVFNVDEKGVKTYQYTKSEVTARKATKNDRDLVAGQTYIFATVTTTPDCNWGSECVETVKQVGIDSQLRVVRYHSSYFEGGDLYYRYDLGKVGAISKPI
jgi:hypothetical protein